MKLIRSTAPIVTRSFHASNVCRAIDLTEEVDIFSSNKIPFKYCESDVNNHRVALGRKPKPLLRSELPGPAPHPLFGLIPAEISCLSVLRRLVKDRRDDLSSVRLSDHFVRLASPLPDSGTIVNSARLRDVSVSREQGRTNILVEVETWSDTDQFLMFNQFCYTCHQQENFGRRKADCQFIKFRGWPPMMDLMPDLVFKVPTCQDRLDRLSKVGAGHTRDPFLTGLWSWRQEQYEGVGVIGMLVEEIMRKIGVEDNQLALVKTGLHHPAPPGSSLTCRVWQQEVEGGGPKGNERQFDTFYFDASLTKEGTPVTNGSYMKIKR